MGLHTHGTAARSAFALKTKLSSHSSTIATLNCAAGCQAQQHAASTPDSLVENAAAEVLDPLSNSDEHGRLVYQHEANRRFASVSERILKVRKSQFGHLRACDDVTKRRASYVQVSASTRRPESHTLNSS